MNEDSALFRYELATVLIIINHYSLKSREEFRVHCAQLIEQLIAWFRLQNDWKTYKHLDYIRQLL